LFVLREGRHLRVAACTDEDRSPIVDGSPQKHQWAIAFCEFGRIFRRNGRKLAQIENLEGEPSHHF